MAEVCQAQTAETAVPGLSVAADCLPSACSLKPASHTQPGCTWQDFLRLKTHFSDMPPDHQVHHSVLGRKLWYCLCLSVPRPTCFPQNHSC